LNNATAIDGDLTSVEFQRRVFNARYVLMFYVLLLTDIEREARLLKQAAATLMKNAQQHSSLLEAWNASVEITNELGM